MAHDEHDERMSKAAARALTFIDQWLDGPLARMDFRPNARAIREARAVHLLRGTIGLARRARDFGAVLQIVARLERLGRDRRGQRLPPVRNDHATLGIHASHAAVGKPTESRRGRS